MSDDRLLFSALVKITGKVKKITVYDLDIQKNA